MGKSSELGGRGVVKSSGEGEGASSRPMLVLELDLVTEDVGDLRMVSRTPHGL
jgi:hypothetical protein